MQCILCLMLSITVTWLWVSMAYRCLHSRAAALVEAVRLLGTLGELTLFLKVIEHIIGSVTVIN